MDIDLPLVSLASKEYKIRRRLVGQKDKKGFRRSLVSSHQEMDESSCGGLIMCLIRTLMQMRFVLRIVSNAILPILGGNVDCGQVQNLANY